MFVFQNFDFVRIYFLVKFVFGKFFCFAGLLFSFGSIHSFGAAWSMLGVNMLFKHETVGRAVECLNVIIIEGRARDIYVTLTHKPTVLNFIIAHV